MTHEQRERLKCSLRTLADYQAATMRLFEETFSLICDERTMEPLEYFRNFFRSDSTKSPDNLIVDQARFTIAYQGKKCFLGSSLPFHFLAYLAGRPNTFVTYADLLEEVWQGSKRSDAAVRSTAKVLRNKLRLAGLTNLAEAIDGSEPGHFALKLPH
jgi:DNA-binding response OmpR family regulator